MTQATTFGSAWALPLVALVAKEGDGDYGISMSGAELAAAHFIFSTSARAFLY